MADRRQAFERATIADLAAVRELLSNSGLPVADLEHHIEAFTLAKSEGMLVGSVGLETYGELSLLRSLCVDEAHRCQGIGLALLYAVAARAAEQGVRALYLLTTGAATYFENQGFVALSREQVPHEIRRTAQFSSLCPSSALCMRKVIA